MIRRRQGSMLLEISLSVLLLSVALVGVAQLLAVAGRQRHESRWRTVAAREVANVTEQVMALPWDQTTPEQLATTPLHASAQSILPDAQLQVEVTDVTDPRATKRIEVTLVYRNTAGMMVDPIKLVAWKFATGGDE